MESENNSEYSLQLSKYCFEVILFTEAWLKPHICDNEILKSEFRLKRIEGCVIFPVHSSI